MPATQARAAIADGVDLVVGYGGDGTQHEVANAVVTAAVATGRRTPMGILPGGTGNGFAREVGIPKKLRDATVLLCTSTRTRAIDVGRLRSVGQAQVDDRYFIQRLYIGIEPEEQTSRELKDRYGVFAYAVSAARASIRPREFHYQVDVDGEVLEFEASKVYVVNSGMTGSGLKVTHGYAIDDGLLDCFVLDKATLDTFVAAAARVPGPPHGGRSTLLPAGPLDHRRRSSRTSRCGRTASTSGGRRSRSTCSRGP